MSEGLREQSVSQAAPRVDESTMRRAVGAATIGNITEWYDYATYGYLAVILGAVFFPNENPTVSLLLSFGTFAVSFLVRPLGSLFFGPLGDRIGRQRTLVITIVLMASATFTAGLLPGYGAIGILAPILLLLVRLVQGFSAGGEYGGASTFTAEYAPDDRRGFWTSFMEFGSLAGFLLASGLVTSLTFALSEDAMTSWGWRVPFLVAGPLGFVGLYLRYKLEDTPSFRALEHTEEVSQTPLRDTLTQHWRQVLMATGILIYSSIGAYLILSYMPSYFSETLGLGGTTSQLVVFIAIAFVMVLIPFAGILSDRVGRKPMLIGASVGFALFAYPAFWLMSLGSWFPALSGLLIISLCQILILGTTPSALPALFPTRVRCGGFAIGYNIAFGVFGGTAPLVATYLVSATGSNFAPAYYLIAAALVSLVPILLSPETAGAPLRDL